MSNQWGYIRPETVNEYISFKAQSDNGGKSPKEDSQESMEYKQLQGSAYLWNTLSIHHIALLADEVGMGKTFQALAVCCLLWRHKPSARILVFTPNYNICTHWESEYRTFINQHYRQVDHIVKSSLSDEPVNAVHLCNHITELPNAIKTHRLLLAKISSLSHLLEDNDDVTAAGIRAEELRATLRQENNNTPPFDLIIIDEAHYFRNYGSGSQKDYAAQALFCDKDALLTERILLLTATPSHRDMDDINNLMRYFRPALVNPQNPKEILEKISLRRLRLLQGANGAYFNKYHYRKESGIPATFEDNPDAELFYALYQKQLFETSLKNGGRGFLYGYLEGFESLGRLPTTEQKTQTKGTENNSNPEVKADFDSAPDSHILSELSKDYYDIYKQLPKHPKYDALVTNIIDDNYWEPDRCLLEDKNLIFVRRIPSVNELTQRINERYEEIFSEKILQSWIAAFPIKQGTRDQRDNDPIGEWKKKAYSRSAYNEITNKILGQIDSPFPEPETEIDNIAEDVSPINEDDNGSEALKCRVLDIFTTKKKSDPATNIFSPAERTPTHASRFRLRFSRNDNPFSIMFEPAADFKDSAYFDHQTSTDSKKTYRDLAFFDRSQSQFNTPLMNMSKDNSVVVRTEKQLPTLWGMCWNLLSEEEKKQLADLSKNEKESFANYVKSGLLYASPAIVELYTLFIEESPKFERLDATNNYISFANSVERNLQKSVTFRLWREALLTFKPYIEKIRGTSKQDLMNESLWNCFTRPPQQPAWYVTGNTANTTRESLRSAFNSPFFPHSLISTSVFQEGVNLHLNCRKVDHYGIGRSFGDNEQRTGRIDRMFGRVNRLLQENKPAHLEIGYPYLKGSLDEVQLASFLQNKKYVSKVLDSGRHEKIDTHIDESATQLEWTEYLQQPRPEVKNPDPYPAKFDDKNEVTYQATRALLSISFDNLIYDLIESLKYLNGIAATAHKLDDKQDRLLLLIDAIRIHRESRNQPIHVELHYHPQLVGNGGHCYFLRLKSPLATKSEYAGANKECLQSTYKKLSNSYSLPKLILDESSHHSSWFHLAAVIDLPLIPHKSIHDFFTLSQTELGQAMEQLIHLTDELEFAAFNQADRGFTEVINNKNTIQKLAIKRNKARVKEDHFIEKNWNSIDNSPDLTVVYRELSTLSEMEWQECAIRNTTTPFVNYILFGDAGRIGICFPKIDFQPEEQTLLSNIIDNLCNIAVNH
jgi:hypothetical protein